MEKIDILFFFDMGSNLGRLTAITDWQKMEISDILMLMATARLDYQQLLEIYPTLQVCRSAGDELAETVLNIIGRMGEFTGILGSTASTLSPQAQGTLNNMLIKAKNYETVLKAEIQMLNVYNVRRIGIYSVPDLIENAEESFPSSVRVKLTPEEVFEFRESGRCLAFGISTASTFHALRALELVMHRFYLATCSPGKDAKLANWGAYIAKFRQSPDVDAKRVAELLQQLKDHDRNLVMHPDTVSSSDESHTLFEMVQAAIMAMALRLEDQNIDKSPVQIAVVTD